MNRIQPPLLLPVPLPKGNTNRNVFSFSWPNASKSNVENYRFLQDRPFEEDATDRMKKTGLLNLGLNLRLLREAALYTLQSTLYTLQREI